VTHDESRVPVVVATGQSIERDANVTALDLAARAVDEAFGAAPGLRARVQKVSVVNILSDVGPAPGTALAVRTGLAPLRTEVTTIGGNSPQWLVNRAAAAVAAGELETVVVVGAEAQHTARAQAQRGQAQRGQAQRGQAQRGQAQRGQAHGAAGDVIPGDGPASGHPPAPDRSEPDPVVGDDRAGVGPAELNAGLITPVHVYAMFESVIAARAGRTPAEHRAELGTLMAPFTEVAAANPFAWYPEVRSASELAAVSSDNRLVAEPYTKRMCAALHVNQGAAVVVTSLAAARRAGVADGAVFCWSGAQAADVWFPSARPDPGSSPGYRAAAEAALDAAGLGVDDIAAFDLYSCFPCAVDMAVEVLGLARDDRRGLTVTGGLPYFGGPGNNYSLHAVATMVQRLRQNGGTGLVSALGWYATKHAVGVYGAAPSTRGWRLGDTTDAQRAIDATAVPVATEAGGPAVVVASTVVSARDGTVTGAPVIARLPDGRHVVAAAETGELAALAGCNLVGREISLSGQGGTPPRYRIEHG